MNFENDNFQIDAIELLNSVKSRIVEFYLYDRYIKDKDLSDKMKKIWSGPPSEGGVISKLWIEGAFPSASSGKTLGELANEGIFNGELCGILEKTGAFSGDRILYKHQEESLRSSIVEPSSDKPAILVSAGTGAGKTECFLLPLLNLLSKEKAEADNGVQAIILYPMNALVNDQVDRLYNWLKPQEEITLFHFTGESPEDKRKADGDGVPLWDSCRMRTRQEARGWEDHSGKKLDEGNRGRVPDIIITNYSMLEYMLCRPQDSVFFGSNLKYIVLDEAHLYRGTLAAEITLLLRRICERCGVHPKDIYHFATSATIGTGNVQELVDFASTIFSKDKNLVKIIKGESIKPVLQKREAPNNPPITSYIAGTQWLGCPTITVDNKGNTILNESSETCRQLENNLLKIVAEKQINKIREEFSHPAKLLKSALETSPIIHDIIDLLWKNKQITIEELAQSIFTKATDDSKQAILNILKLAASARENVGDYPVIPHRMHMLVRLPDSFSVCLNRNCNGPTHLMVNGLGTILPGDPEKCPHCDSLALTLVRCNNCGEWALTALKDTKYFKNRKSGIGELNGRHYFTFKKTGTEISVNIKSGEFPCDNQNGVLLNKSDKCPNCESPSDDFKNIDQPYQINIPLSIVAETTLSQLPVFPTDSRDWLPSRGRRLLCFSDSRREAASVGAKLPHQHELQVVRAAIVECFDEYSVTDNSEDIKEEIEDIKRELAKNGLTSSKKQRREKRLTELKEELTLAEIGGTVDFWVDKLKEIRFLSELIDLDSSKRHNIKDWKQAEWDRNFGYIKKQLEILFIRELGRRQNSLEDLGLLEVTYPGLKTLQPPDELLGKMPTSQLRNILNDNWTNILASLCDTLRMDGVFTLGDYEKDILYPYGYNLIAHWCSENDTNAYLNRFVGVKSEQRRRVFIENILEQAGIKDIATKENLSKEILQSIFRQLVNKASDKEFKWLETEKRETGDRKSVDSIRILFPNLCVRKPVEMYQCSRSGKLWPRNTLGCAPVKGCNGNLVKVSFSQLDADVRYGRQRNEYKSSGIFRLGIWGEEHSAQLSAKENRRLQDLFKIGVRNILSSTTTMELGIDIGGLNAVLMTNIPPGKANYLQRAGRAGRRSDGSSAVITFSRPRPFDREVFLKFDNYLGKTLRKPVVFLDRKRVVLRHIQAFLLGEFFRKIYPSGKKVGAMSAYSSMGYFCGVKKPQKWDKSENKKPAAQYEPIKESPSKQSAPWWKPEQDGSLDGEFTNFISWMKDWEADDIEKSIKDLSKETALTNSLEDWNSFLSDILDNFKDAISRWRIEYDELLKTWLEIEDKKENRPLANALYYQLRSMHDTTVIESLSDRQFLPGYGFPVGLQNLKVIVPDEDGKNARTEDSFRLQRASIVALGEYVPDSRLLAGGKVITSHGLQKHWSGMNTDNGFGIQGTMSHCINGHFYHWTSSGNSCVSSLRRVI